MRERLLPVALISSIVALVAAAPASAQTVTCGQVIVANTTVDNDLSCPDQVPGESALRIGAPGITLDLNGHRITGHSHAIVNDGYRGVTIRNGTVGGNNHAIVLTGVTRNTVDHVVVTGITDGLRVSDADHTTISSNVLQGVTLSASGHHNTLSGNEMHGFEGLLTVGGSFNRVIENTTDDSGIGLYGLSYSRVARNHVVVDLLPFELVGSNDNELIDNVVVGVALDHGDPVLRLENSSRNLLRGNAIFRGRTALVSGSENVLRKNVAFGSPGDGFVIEALAGQTSLINNLAVQNGDDGFDIESAPGGTVTRNTADKNADLGIEAVTGVVDGGGNKASGNGNPLQCVNIVCG
jgi:large repetitive protein